MAKNPQITKAREKAELMEFERMNPRLSDAIDARYEFQAKNRGKNSKENAGILRSLYEADVNAAEADRNENARVGRKPRSEADVAELAREISRFESPKGGMRKGGMVKKSKPKATKSRGDGCAVRGKTKGRMV